MLIFFKNVENQTALSYENRYTIQGFLCIPFLQLLKFWNIKFWNCQSSYSKLNKYWACQSLVLDMIIWNMFNM
jgi:hypothetical protein